MNLAQLDAKLADWQMSGKDLNKPCACNSGLKYKRCYLIKPPTPPTAEETAAQRQRAEQSRRRGQMALAKTLGLIGGLGVWI